MNRKSGKSKLFAAFVAALLAPAAWAGSETGSVQPGWFAYSDGLVFLFLSGTHNGSPCTIAERWAIDPSTQAGKIHFAVFLAAAASGRTVALDGAGTCVHSNTELVTVLTVVD
jgi:hypothetical protein